MLSILVKPENHLLINGELMIWSHITSISTSGFAKGRSYILYPLGPRFIERDFLNESGAHSKI